MGFKDFCKEKECENKIKSQSINDENAEEIFNKYKDMEQDQLLLELYKNIEKQKKDGTFNYNGLCEMVEKMSPFLSKEQNLKIKQILKEIK